MYITDDVLEIVVKSSSSRRQNYYGYKRA